MAVSLASLAGLQKWETMMSTSVLQDETALPHAQAVPRLFHRIRCGIDCHTGSAFIKWMLAVPEADTPLQATQHTVCSSHKLPTLRHLHIANTGCPLLRAGITTAQAGLGSSRSAHQASFMVLLAW